MTAIAPGWVHQARPMARVLGPLISYGARMVAFLARLGLVTVAACSSSSDRQAGERGGADAALTACAGEPAGATVAPIGRVRSIDAGGGASHVGVLAAADAGAVALGSYADSLELGDHALSGGGTFAAWLRDDATVDALARLSPAPLEVSAAVVTADGHLWLAAPFEDALELSVGPSPTTLVASGRAAALLALTADRRLARAVVIEGAVAIDRLVANEAGVTATGELAYGDARVDDGALVLQASDADHSQLGLWLDVPLAGPVDGWLADGPAVSTFRALAGAPAGLLAGRFGGYGPVTARFGPSAASPVLEAVSSDDDPAFDVVIGRADPDGALWAKRVRAYFSDLQLAVPAAVIDGELVVAIAASGYDVVFEEGAVDEARFALDRVYPYASPLARYDVAGRLRWARESPGFAALVSDGCDLYGFAARGALEAAWVAQPGEADEVAVDLADGLPIARLDGDGRVVAVRTLATDEDDWTLARLTRLIAGPRPGTFLFATSASTGEPRRARIEWLAW